MDAWARLEQGQRLNALLLAGSFLLFVAAWMIGNATIPDCWARSDCGLSPAKSAIMFSTVVMVGMAGILFAAGLGAAIGVANHDAWKQRLAVHIETSGETDWENHLHGKTATSQAAATRRLFLPMSFPLIIVGVVSMINGVILAGEQEAFTFVLFLFGLGQTVWGIVLLVRSARLGEAARTATPT